LIGSKISRRYARALLSLGEEDGRYGDYGMELRDFTDFCADNGEFFQVISSQIFSVDDRKKVLETVLEKSGYSGIIKNFLRLLLDKNRIGSVKEISEYYARFTDEISNITRASVITARPLKNDAMERLTGTLKGLTSGEVKVEVHEDESLIGGVIVKLGDLVLDGSVKAQVEGFKESLKRGGYN